VPPIPDYIYSQSCFPHRYQAPDLTYFCPRLTLFQPPFRCLPHQRCVRPLSWVCTPPGITHSCCFVLGIWRGLVPSLVLCLSRFLRPESCVIEVSSFLFLYVSRRALSRVVCYLFLLFSSFFSLRFPLYHIFTSDLQFSRSHSNSPTIPSCSPWLMRDKKFSAVLSRAPRWYSTFVCVAFPICPSMLFSLTLCVVLASVFSFFFLFPMESGESLFLRP